MSRDVPERPGHGLPDDPRAGLVAVRAVAAGLAVIGAAFLGAFLFGCGGGDGLRRRVELDDRVRRRRGIYSDDHDEHGHPERRAAAEGARLPGRRSIRGGKGPNVHRSRGRLRRVRHSALLEHRIRREAGMRSGPTTGHRRDVPQLISHRSQRDGGRRWTPRSCSTAVPTTAAPPRWACCSRPGNTG